MRRALAFGALLAACASEREPPRAAATAGGEELCTGSVPEAVVRDVLGRVLRDNERPARRCSVRYLLGDRVRVQADGHVDRMYMGRCALQHSLSSCAEEDFLPTIWFPPLDRGACAWIDVPYDLVPAIDEPVRTDAAPP